MNTTQKNQIITDYTEQILSHLSHTKMVVTQYEKINQQSKINVARIHLNHPFQGKQTLIIKHGNPFHPQHTPMTLIEEQINYHFLHTQEVQFPYCPKLIYSEPGLIILEDLNQDINNIIPSNQILDKIATLFCTLHHHTRSKNNIYTDYRKEHNLTEDQRKYNQEGTHTLAILGLHYLKHVALHCQVTTSHILEEALDAIYNCLTTPSSFITFIHDDLSDGRQSIIRNQHYYLVDFERARFGHALLDFSKLIVGKIEFDTKAQVYGLNFVNFPTDILELYRKKIYTQSQLHYSDKDWKTHCAAALLYTCLHNIGRISELTIRGQHLNTHTALLYHFLNRIRYIGQHYSYFNAIISLSDNIATQMERGSKI